MHPTDVIKFNSKQSCPCSSSGYHEFLKKKSLRQSTWCQNMKKDMELISYNKQSFQTFKRKGGHQSYYNTSVWITKVKEGAEMKVLLNNKKEARQQLMFPSRIWPLLWWSITHKRCLMPLASVLLWHSIWLVAKLQLSDDYTVPVWLYSTVSSTLHVQHSGQACQVGWTWPPATHSPANPSSALLSFPSFSLVALTGIVTNPASLFLISDWSFTFPSYQQLFDLRGNYSHVD